MLCDTIYMHLVLLNSKTVLLSPLFLHVFHVLSLPPPTRPGLPMCVRFEFCTQLPHSAPPPPTPGRGFIHFRRGNPMDNTVVTCLAADDVYDGHHLQHPCAVLLRRTRAQRRSQHTSRERPWGRAAAHGLADCAGVQHGGGGWEAWVEGRTCSLGAVAGNIPQKGRAATHGLADCAGVQHGGWGGGGSMGWGAHAAWALLQGKSLRRAGRPHMAWLTVQVCSAGGGGQEGGKSRVGRGGMF
jgi:hypothetical protein